MKIAALADIHSNLQALEAVLADIDAWSPDAVMVAGDVVNRGPDPRACMEHVRERVANDGWRIIKGNHEDFVVTAGEGHGGLPEWQRGLYQHSAWTHEQLGDLAGELASWPDEMEVQGPDGTCVRSVHASMHGNRYGLNHKMTENELHGGMQTHGEVLIVGHTHVPFIRDVKGRLLINVGAVGLPFDRDPRASYARLTFDTGWRAEIVRLPYDRTVTEARYGPSGYAEKGGPMIPLILDELRHARPRLRQWHVLYEAKVESGQLTLDESVAHQLANAP